MSRFSVIANQLWHWSVQAEARRFRQALHQPAATQTALLNDYLQTNRATQAGERWDFAAIQTVADYQRRVPLTTYDEYAAQIEQIGNGATGVLTAEPITRFELSSGSTAATKLIPYTRQLKCEFQRGLAPWIADLFAHAPQLKRGPAYWSITPLTAGERHTAGGIPIGFEADSDYLGPLGAWIENTLAVPNAVKGISDPETFRYVTLLFLLRQSNLRLFSVWNPTFLTLLLDALPDWWEPLLADLAQGTLTPPTPLSPEIAAALQRRLGPARTRSRQLARIQPHDYRAIWPSLGLISCWMDGPSAQPAADLQTRFAGIAMQGKGLLATEAFVTLPLMDQPGGALAITAHFFEFIDAQGEPRLAHQLEQGRPYEVVVTTGGGFYRYQLHDLVEVVGRIGETPCLRFVGKTNRISDRFGEKLNEQFVAGVLRKLFADFGLDVRFALLAPEEINAGTRYTLYLELVAAQAPPTALAAALDAALRANFHYNYCRQLKQLAGAAVMQIEHGAASYLAVCERRGQKLGNIKPALLDAASGWTDWLQHLAQI